MTSWIWRTDTLAKTGGQTIVMFGMEVLGAHPVFIEYLLMGYSLNGGMAEKAVRHIEGASHEFILCSVSPLTPIDFKKSLFEQPGVSPLQPPNIGFQLAHETDAGLKARLQHCVNDILEGRLSPDPQKPYEWEARFRDGFALHRTPGAPLLQEAG